MRLFRSLVAVLSAVVICSAVVRDGRGRRLP